MRIKEKLAKEDGTHMYCYKQVFFWVCYEQSAYIVSLRKAYKPSKKWIKNIAQEVVTIGFPNTALQQWVHEQGVKSVISTEVLNVFEWGNTFVAEGYVKWKNTKTNRKYYILNFNVLFTSCGLFPVNFLKLLLKVF